MGLAQAGTILRDGDNLKIQGVSPGGVAIAGKIAWQAGTPAVPWQLLTQTWTASTEFTTAPIDTSGATLLVAITASWGGVAPVTDNVGNTFTQGPTADIANAYSAIHYCIVPLTDIVHTFTFSANYQAFIILAFRGPQLITVDQSSTTAAGPATDFQFNPITPTVNNSLILAGYSISDYNVDLSGIDSGFTLAEVINTTGGNEGGAAAYLVQQQIATVAPTWSFAGTIQALAGTMLSFKPT